MTLWASGYQHQLEPCVQQSLNACACPLPCVQLRGPGGCLALVCYCSLLPEDPAPFYPQGSGSGICLKPGNWAKDHDLLLGPPGHASLISSPWTLVQSPRTLCSVHHHHGTSGPWPVSNLTVSTWPLVAGCHHPCHCPAVTASPTTSRPCQEPPLTSSRHWCLS